MEETFPWTEQIVRLLDEAEGRCCSAYTSLAAALPHLESPSALSTGGARVITLVEGKLEGASTDLTRALSSMEAADLFDLRRRGGCGYSLARASSPPSSILELQEARARGENALRAIHRCCGHLDGAKLLLGHPGVPGADGCIEAERCAAVRALEAALCSMRDGGGGGGGG